MSEEYTVSLSFLVLYASVIFLEVFFVVDFISFTNQVKLADVGRPTATVELRSLLPSSHTSADVITEST